MKPNCSAVPEVYRLLKCMENPVAVKKNSSCSWFLCNKMGDKDKMLLHVFILSRSAIGLYFCFRICSRANVSKEKGDQWLNQLSLPSHQFSKYFFIMVDNTEYCVAGHLV